ncbi:MAG: hypothetical protein ACE5E9_04125 [Nitrospinaceae bacterium]
MNYRQYRWMVLNLLFLSLLILFYWLDHPVNGKRGSTFLGYTYGVLALAGILFLMGFGLRKRSYASSRGTVLGWLSGHVWIGISLIAIVPMHGGFNFGPNVHTLGYVLLVAVVLSGVWGACNYLYLPSQILSNRGGGNIRDLLVQIQVIGSDLESLEQQKSDSFIRLMNTIDSPFKPTLTGLIFSGKNQGLTKDKEVTDLITSIPRKEQDEAIQAVRLVRKKMELQNKLKQEAGAYFWLKIWLYFHVPLSIALLAVVAIHVFSVFYF